MASVVQRFSASRRAAALVVAAAITAMLAMAVSAYSIVELSRFARADVRRATMVYASGQVLDPGLHVGLVDLASTLARLGYTETRTAPSAPGQFRRGPGRWDIVLLGGEGASLERGAHVSLVMQGDRIARVARDGREVVAVTLEGEALAGMSDRPGQDYRPVRLEDTPPVVVNAMLATEDHRFFEHGPLDLRGLARAAWANLRTGRIAQGGSTLTQQLVKSRLLTPQRTWLRKAREAWLALLVEWRYSKPQILEAYLNEVYLGRHGIPAILGVGAGARAYFDKSVHQLTPGEAAILAGMVRAPNTYSPSVSPARARERRDDVLAQMRALGMLGEGEYDRARREPVRAPAGPASGQAAAYFTDYVRQELEQRLGDPVLRGQAGAQILTTLDPALQRFAESAVRRGLDRIETAMPGLRRQEAAARLQAALVAIDPATGEIRALVGGRDYQTSQFNRAVL